jgi:hypothetical protein
MANDTTYDPVSKNGAAVTSALMAIWERFCRPEDFSTQSGVTLLQEIINVWKYFFPKEYQDTLHDNKLDRASEKQVSDMEIGYNSIMYPPTLFNLIKAMFPNVNLSSRKTQRVMQEYAPFLKVTNLKI